MDFYEAGNKLWQVRLEQIIEPVIEKQFIFHKGVTPRDVYKLLYQINCGAEHLITNVESAKKEFFKEVSELQLPKKEAIYLPVFEVFLYGVTRVNFIPYALAGGDFNKLFDSFVRDSSDFCKSMQLTPYYEAFESLNKKKNWLNQRDVSDFFEFIKAKNFPAVHHSKTYKDKLSKEILEKPHYRIIRTSLKLD